MSAQAALVAGFGGVLDSVKFHHTLIFFMTSYVASPAPRAASTFLTPKALPLPPPLVRKFVGTLQSVWFSTALSFLGRTFCWKRSSRRCCRRSYWLKSPGPAHQTAYFRGCTICCGFTRCMR